MWLDKCGEGVVSLHPGQASLMEHAGWLCKEDDRLTDDQGYFDIDIPLSLLLGFAEDYNRIIVNAKHELILIRANTDTNAVIQTAAEDYKIKLDKIDWLIPYIKASDTEKINLLTILAQNPPLRMPFRAWKLFVFPLLQATSNHVWTMATSTQLEKPRYIIFMFQTGRKNSTRTNANLFDHCNLRNIKVHLNSECDPYGNLNLDFATNQFALAYAMYANFQTSY